MKLDWYEVSTPPGSWAAKAHGIHLFTAKRKANGYLLVTKLRNVTRNGKIQFCASIYEAQNVADDVVHDYLETHGEIKLYERKRHHHGYDM